MRLDLCEGRNRQLLHTTYKDVKNVVGRLVVGGWWLDIPYKLI